MIPTKIDSNGNPGIPGVGTAVCVLMELLMLIVLEEATVEAVTNVVCVDTVENMVAVEVAVNTPPKAEKRSIVDSGVL